jgi:hypothetical protein
MDLKNNQEVRRFLESKNTTLEKCTTRQLQILKSETHKMWELYHWGPEKKIGPK